MCSTTSRSATKSPRVEEENFIFNFAYHCIGKLSVFFCYSFIHVFILIRPFFHLLKSHLSLKKIVKSDHNRGGGLKARFLLHHVIIVGLLQFSRKKGLNKRFIVRLGCFKNKKVSQKGFISWPCISLGTKSLKKEIYFLAMYFTGTNYNGSV